VTSGVPFEVALLAMYGITFFVRESHIFTPIRARLTSFKFFSDMLSCVYCTGFHAGWVVFLLLEPFPSPESFSFSFVGDLLVYAFAGMAFSGVMDAFAVRLEGNGF